MRKIHLRAQQRSRELLPYLAFRMRQERELRMVGAPSTLETDIITHFLPSGTVGRRVTNCQSILIFSSGNSVFHVYMINTGKLTFWECCYIQSLYLLVGCVCGHLMILYI